jgi:hypothetical protein
MIGRDRALAALGLARPHPRAGSGSVRRNFGGATRSAGAHAELRDVIKNGASGVRNAVGARTVTDERPNAAAVFTLSSKALAPDELGKSGLPPFAPTPAQVKELFALWEGVRVDARLPTARTIWNKVEPSTDRARARSLLCHLSDTGAPIFWLLSIQLHAARSRDQTRHRRYGQRWREHHRRQGPAGASGAP